MSFHCGNESTTDFEKALSWHNKGKFVSVIGQVIISRCGKSRVLNESRKSWYTTQKVMRFEELLKYHPRWKITVESKGPEGLDSKPWYYRSHKKKDPRFEELLVRAKIKSLSKDQASALVRGKRTSKKSKRGYTAVTIPGHLQRFEDMKRSLARKGASADAITLYHGTKMHFVDSILQEGLKPNSGMLGKGVYFGKPQKARNYSDFAMFHCRVLLGRCKELERVERLETRGNEKFDSLHIGDGKKGGVFKGFLLNEEWVVRNEGQILVLGLISKRSA